MNANSPADQLPPIALVASRTSQSRIPDERDRQGPTINQINNERVFDDAHTFGQRLLDFSG